MLNRSRTREYLSNTLSGSYGVVGSSNFTWSANCTGFARCRDSSVNNWKNVRALTRAISSLDEHGGDSSHARRMKKLVLQYDTGGPLYIQKLSVDVRCPVVDVVRTTPYTTEWLRGHVLPSPCRQELTVKSTDVLASSSNEVLFALGGTAISRCKPLQPKANLGVALGELREGLPSLLGSRILSQGVTKEALAHEYLNYNFGWKPLISDINDAVSAFEKADATWSQIARDAGRHIRRRYDFPDSSSSSNSIVAGYAYGWPTMSTYMYKKKGTHSLSTTSTKKTWFSGAFRYALPSVGDRWSSFRRQARRWRSIYGLSLDPQTLWNLTPWTWLSDWFLDLQPLMGWLSSAIFDGLTMQYGFVMEHSSKTVVRHLTGLVLLDGTVIDSRVQWNYDTKRRVYASPYGFGVDWSDFSPYQLATLTALGITRGNHRGPQ